MSLCNNCNNRPICNVFSDMSKHMSYADIVIQRCKFCRDTDVKESISSVPRTTAYNRSEIDSNKINELSNKNRKMKIEQQNLEKKKEQKPNPKIVATPLVLDHTCKSCNATTFKEDSSNCDECGKEICSCCATVDGDTKRILCEKCWLSL